MLPRTDLAMEAHRLWRERASETSELPGVRAQTVRQRGIAVTTVEILDEEGAQALGKPVGKYVTLELAPARLRERVYASRAERQLAQQLTALLALEPNAPVLVVGLGNAAVTPDAVGPRTVESLLVTRHVAGEGSPFRPVAALAPGVLGSTGLEAAELVRCVVERIRPARVVAVDALVSREPNRVCAAVQLSDTGIVPGSGVGNRRAAFDRATLGVPVVAVGVPTVVEARTLCLDLLHGADDAHLPDAGLIVTPRDIDPAIRRIARLLSGGLNLALQDGLSAAELDAVTE